MTWAPDYVTASELKNYLRIPDVADDVFVALWITAASRNVDDFCGRQFGLVTVPEARTYTAVYDRHLGCWVTEIDDVMDLTGFTVTDAAGTAVTGYTFEPVNALKKGRPLERILTAMGGKLTLLAPWGWSQAADGPKVAKLGLMLQAARLAARRDSPFGIAGSPADGTEVRLLATLDPDFKTSLKPFRRDWWAA